MSTVNRRGHASLCHVVLSAAQVIPSGAPTQVLFNTKIFDLLDEYDEVTTHYFIASRTGYYLARAKASFVGLAAGTEYRVGFYLNGGVLTPTTKTAVPVVFEQVEQSLFFHLNRTNTVGVWVEHNAGINKNIRNGTYDTLFDVFRVY